MKNTTTSLYRHFDKDDTLLYVGISLSAYTRLSQHNTHSKWANLSVKMTTEHYATRDEALFAEKLAIESESPIYNIIHNGKSSPNIGKEPDYIGILTDGSVQRPNRYSENTTLQQLFVICDNNNFIFLPVEVRKKIAQNIELTPQSLSNCISALGKQKHIVKVDSNLYLLNPYWYAKNNNPLSSHKKEKELFTRLVNTVMKEEIS